MCIRLWLWLYGRERRRGGSQQRGRPAYTYPAIKKRISIFRLILDGLNESKKKRREKKRRELVVSFPDSWSAWNLTVRVGVGIEKGSSMYVCIYIYMYVFIYLIMNNHSLISRIRTCVWFFGHAWDGVGYM